MEANRKKAKQIRKKVNELSNTLRIISKMTNPYLTDEFKWLIGEYLDEIDENMEKMPQRPSVKDVFVPEMPKHPDPEIGKYIDGIIDKMKKKPL